MECPQHQENSALLSHKSSSPLSRIKEELPMDGLSKSSHFVADYSHLMQIFALFMLIGFFLSWLIPETKGKTLEELSGENEEDELRRQAEVNQRQREEEEERRAERRARVTAMDSPIAETTGIDKLSV
jgi:uncharacterized membrane protein